MLIILIISCSSLRRNFANLYAGGKLMIQLRGKSCTRRVRKVKIHHVQVDREICMHIMATLPSTLILYL